MAIGGIKKSTLNKQEILDRISEYDIFKFYMPNSNWKLNVKTYSPFREERTPSFIISQTHHGVNFYDFGDTSKKGDCFAFVKELYLCSNYDEVLKKIDKDFGLGISSREVKDYKKIVAQYKQPEKIVKQYSFIQVKTKRFTHEELAYWNQYYQDEEDLRANNVYSIQELFLNKKRWVVDPKVLTFGYLYDGHWKIYKPYADKKFKWVPNNVPITAMDGKDDIKNCNIAFITKSKKDYMVMKKVFPTCCAVQNEGIGCFDEDNVQYIIENSNRQILSFDSDATGVENSKAITEKFGFEYCNVPKKYLSEGIKDWADLAKHYGLKVIEDLLINKSIIK